MFFQKLFAITFVYKNNKFVANMLTYPDCSAWRHLLAHVGLLIVNCSLGTFSFASRQQCEFAWNLDWTTGLFESFVIGICDCSIEICST